MAHLGQEVNKGPDDLRRGLSYDRDGLVCAADAVMARVRAGAKVIKTEKQIPHPAKGAGIRDDKRLGWRT